MDSSWDMVIWFQTGLTKLTGSAPPRQVNILHTGLTGQWQQYSLQNRDMVRRRRHPDRGYA
ncbi:uncharacterized protein METZ01_LOCUS372812 [marine metagenome]|uniref:Uncharacterized protein n=1 Tax=marine metagenome TaxID=408172 RepID=A0A382TF15_9ZZZZ